MTISSFKTASQLSSSVLISNCNNVFCSSVNPATHFALSNLTAGSGAAVQFATERALLADLTAAEEEAVLATGPDLGALKKDVMLASCKCCLGFLASGPGWVAALRLRAEDIATCAELVVVEWRWLFRWEIGRLVKMWRRSGDVVGMVLE